MSGANRRVQLAEGFVLHHRPYRDTSRIIEVFTREQGRLTLFARGVRGPNSRLAPVLQPFRRLLLSFMLGRGDAAQLSTAELADPSAPGPRPGALMSAYYINELLLKLTGRLDAQSTLFDAYAHALRRLAAAEPDAPLLREFELELLQVCGYGIDFDELDPAHGYLFSAGAGFLLSESPDALSGAALLALSQRDWAQPLALVAAQKVLRAALDHCLDGAEIRTRAVARSVRRQVSRNAQDTP